MNIPCNVLLWTIHAFNFYYQIRVRQRNNSFRSSQCSLERSTKLFEGAISLQFYFPKESKQTAGLLHIVSYYKDQVFYSFLLVWSIFSSIQLDFHWDHNIICLYILSSVPKTNFNCFSKCRASAVGPQIKCVQYWSKSCLHSMQDSIFLLDGYKQSLIFSRISKLCSPGHNRAQLF